MGYGTKYGIGNIVTMGWDWIDAVDIVAMGQSMGLEIDADDIVAMGQSMGLEVIDADDIVAMGQSMGWS